MQSDAFFLDESETDLD